MLRSHYDNFANNFAGSGLILAVSHVRFGFTHSSHTYSICTYIVHQAKKFEFNSSFHKQYAFQHEHNYVFITKYDMRVSFQFPLEYFRVNTDVYDHN